MNHLAFFTPGTIAAITNSDSKEDNIMRSLDVPGMIGPLTESKMFIIPQPPNTNTTAENSIDPENEHDFNKAYSRLLHKLYNESGNSLLVPQKDIAKLAAKVAMKENKFIERNQKFIEERVIKEEQ